MKLTNKKINTPFLFWLKLIVPFVVAIFIYALSFFPAFIETYYSTQFYLFVANCQRVLFGFVAVSIGDILYGCLIGYIVFWFVMFIKCLVKKQITWQKVAFASLQSIKFLLWAYIFFNVLWGLNYSRLGIANQLQLPNAQYSTEELHDLSCDILEKLNGSRLALGDSNYQYPDNKIIYYQAFDAYQNTKNTFQFLNYQHYSVKPSLLSTLVSYAGYSGYYNPFSGEAQLNTDLPKFITPFVACHEMAHQLGYASESEASFVGYLTATHSDNPLFIYSAYFDIFMSANGELFAKDFYSAYLNLKQLNSIVKKDRRTYKDYITGKQNNMQPVVSKLYDQYLKANQQKSGIKSYNEVIGWLIAYKKKYAKI